MAIEKNSFKGSRLDHEFSPNSKDTSSSDDEEIHRRVLADESDDDDDDEFNDADSGAGSDDFDLLELGETGAEFCQIGNSTCSVPFELYDLSGLDDILSVDVWNEILTEEDRFSLAKYLPDLDQDTCIRTLKELLEGQNLHFGSPVKKLFKMLKGGLCEPRVALYREGLKFFQKRQHYHHLRKHQNSMVSNLCQMRDAWFSCRGYSIEEKIRVLNIMKSDKNSIYENMEVVGLASDSSEEEELWAKQVKDRKNAVKNSEFPLRMPPLMGLEVAKYGKQNPKGILRLAETKFLPSKEMASQFPSVYQGMDVNSRPFGLPLPTSRQKVMGQRDQMRIDEFGDDFEDAITGHRGKKREIFKSDELAADSFSGFSKNDVRAYGRTKNANNLSAVDSAVAKLSNRQFSQEFARKAKYPENGQQFSGRAQQMKKGNRADLLENGEPIWHSNSNNQGHGFSVESYRKSDDWSMMKKKNREIYRSSSPPINERNMLSELRSRPSQQKIRGISVQNGVPDNRTKKMNKNYARNEETESDSSEQFDEEDEDLFVRTKKGKFVKKTMRDKLGKSERMHISSIRANPFSRRQKDEATLDYNIIEEDDLIEDENAIARLGKKGRGSKALKKRKAKEEFYAIDERDEDVVFPSNGQLQMEESVSLKKKGKRKMEAETEIATSDMELLYEPPVSDIETKPQKKPYTPITPTVHTGFSFSVIHLLSAVRMAMISPLAEDPLEPGKSENPEASKPDNNDVPQVNGPSLTIQEIVNRVKSNPGDPCILETQEPLQDLVRGVLRIFASKTAPLGTKGWKQLVVYQKPSRSWSWIGPLSQSSTDNDIIEEVTSPEYWGLPHKMLVKLVDSFANWLKSGQETLQQIGILPAPPVSLMQANLDEKERFKDLRAQKSLHTINPSSEEVRDYFRKEEVLRYSIPDRTFSYTAADGKKSIVAPLRRCGGKPTSKARDHFMLKRDRPPHVTILCLVRDAASRLPGSIGTRADVCTLIRDSQFVVDDVSDAQVNQVVSGALDRLHYERDPCVQFDGERKLWVYLHREREEEDFEDDGTSSTKKWKRQKKEPADQSERAAAVTGFELGSDLNVELPGAAGEDGKITEFVYSDENGETGRVVEQGNPMVWDSLGLNPMEENKLMCQENATNEDFDGEILGTSLL